MSLIAKNITQTFKQADSSINVLNNVSVIIESGDIKALTGASGSGKTTFLQILGLLEKPTHGEIILDNLSCINLSDVEQSLIRRKNFGFVYQFHYLLNEFSALENVVIAQLINDIPKKQAIANAKDMLVNVGLEHRIHHNPKKLSGGEQQRVAIARALVNKPKFLIADEPTGNLDPKTSQLVFELLLDQVKKNNMGAIIATHNTELAKLMDAVIEF